LFEQSQLYVVIRNVIRWCCHHWHEYGVDCLVLEGCRNHGGRNRPHSLKLHSGSFDFLPIVHYLWSCLDSTMAATCAILHFWL